MDHKVSEENQDQMDFQENQELKVFKAHQDTDQLENQEQREIKVLKDQLELMDHKVSEENQDQMDFQENQELKVFKAHQDEKETEVLLDQLVTLERLVRQETLVFLNQPVDQGRYLDYQKHSKTSLV